MTDRPYLNLPSSLRNMSVGSKGFHFWQFTDGMGDIKYFYNLVLNFGF